MDDNQSGIHFTVKRERHQSGSSSNSMQSLAGTMSRVNTVASALKRFLSRDDGRSNMATPEGPPARSVSQLSISNRPLPPAGSMKITDQVIMEVDEQMTIQSQKHDFRPTAKSVFENAPQTAPIDSANTGQPSYHRAFSTGLPVDHNAVLSPGGIETLLSVSAPLGDNVSANEFTPILDPSNRVSYGSQDSQEEPSEPLDYNLQADDFELLKARREQEKIDKQKDLLARTISTQPAPISTPLDTDKLIENLAALSSEQMQQQPPKGSSPPPPSTADTAQSWSRVSRSSTRPYFFLYEDEQRQHLNFVPDNE